MLKLETQEFKHSEDSGQKFVATTELHTKILEDHYNFHNFNDFVNRGETSGASQVCLQEGEDFCQELALYEENQHYEEQTLDFSFQPKWLSAENNNQSSHI